MSLAAEDDVLILADGTRILPDGRTEEEVAKKASRQQRYIEIPSNTEAQKLVARTRRKLTDLPAVPQTMNAINVVLCYSIFGLSDEEIALATSLTASQVTNIRMSPAYAEMQTSMLKAVAEAETDDVRMLFTQKAKLAAHRIAELVDSDDEGVALHASKDLLDRAGHRPADVVQHNVSIEQSLRIVHVSKTSPTDAPMIDITPTE